MIFKFSLGRHVSRFLKERSRPALTPDEIHRIDEALRRVEAMHGKLDDETLTMMAAITVALYSQDNDGKEPHDAATVQP